MRQIDKIKLAIKENNEQVKDVVEKILWQKYDTITRNAQLEASKIATEISKIVGVSNDDYNNNTLKMIRQISVPKYMMWDFWNLVQSWVDYWVNRYVIKTTNLQLKHAIYCVIRNAVPFGEGVLAINDKYEEGKENVGEVKYLSGSVLERETNYNGETYKVKMLPTYLSLDNTSYVSANKDGYKYAKGVSEKSKWVNSKNAVLTWRWNRIGDFVWCMKELLIELYIKSIIEQNTSTAIYKPIMFAKNPNTLATEINIQTNPYIPYSIIMDELQTGGTGAISNKIEYTQHQANLHSEALITILKHHQEWYYAKYGRPIQSMKKQTLSADASLTIASSEAIAREHDERVKMFIEKVKEITGEKYLELIIDEMNEPDTENADDNDGTGNSTEGKETATQAGNKEGDK